MPPLLLVLCLLQLLVARQLLWRQLPWPQLSGVLCERQRRANPCGLHDDCRHLRERGKRLAHGHNGHARHGKMCPVVRVGFETKLCRDCESLALEGAIHALVVGGPTLCALVLVSVLRSPTRAATKPF